MPNKKFNNLQSQNRGRRPSVNNFDNYKELINLLYDKRIYFNNQYFHKRVTRNGIIFNFKEDECRGRVKNPNTGNLEVIEDEVCRHFVMHEVENKSNKIHLKKTNNSTEVPYDRGIGYEIQFSRFCNTDEIIIENGKVKIRERYKVNFLRKENQIQINNYVNHNNFEEKLIDLFNDISKFFEDNYYKNKVYDEPSIDGFTSRSRSMVLPEIYTKCYQEYIEKNKLKYKINNSYFKKYYHYKIKYLTLKKKLSKV